MYAAAVAGDGMGLGRLIWMCDTVKPDVIVIQNDPWNIPAYLQVLQDFESYKNVPVVAAIAVDGKNIPARSLNGLALAIFWTQFALDEARAAGYSGPGCVIPLGVNRNVYFPDSKSDARLRRLGDHQFYQDAFIVGNVNRNQPRKRWDLTIKYFANWVKSNDLKDALLYLHVAPTGDLGVKVKQLMNYYGILKHLLLVEPAVFYGVSEEEMRDTYNLLDVFINTGQGEGFGLTAIEAMACQVPVVAGDWSGLGDWGKDAIDLVPCTTTAIGPPYINVIGGVPDETQFIAELDRLYRDKDYRQQWSDAGFKRSQEDRFTWSNIGQAYVENIGHVLTDTSQLAETR